MVMACVQHPLNHQSGLTVNEASGERRGNRCVFECFYTIMSISDLSRGCLHKFSSNLFFF